LPKTLRNIAERAAVLSVAVELPCIAAVPCTHDEKQSSQSVHGTIPGFEA